MGIVRWIGRGLALGGAVAAGGALFVTARHVLTTPQPLRSELEGDAKVDRKHGGDLYYTVAGPEDALPVVLAHDFYSGASSYEYRSVFSRLAQRYRVYAPDWLGFGMSERPPLAFTGEFYATALAGFLRDAVQRPAIVIAHGRAANVAARAASDEPDLFERLALVSPEIDAGMRLDPTAGQTVVRTAQRASLGMLPYALFSTRPLLRRMALERADGAASEDALDHQYASAHQFGGQYALLALMTGELDLPIQNELPLVQPPLLLLAGERDTHRPRDVMEDLAILNPYAELEIIPAAGASVFEDQPLRFLTAFNAWVERPTIRQRATATHLTPAEARAAQQGASDGPAVPPKPEVPDLPEEPEEPEVPEIPELPHVPAIPETPEEPVIPEVEPEISPEPPTPPEVAPEPTPEPGPDATETATTMSPRKPAMSAKTSSKSSAKSTATAKTASKSPDATQDSPTKPASRKRSTTASGAKVKDDAAVESAPGKKNAAKNSRSKTSSRTKKATPPEGV
ncbi:MAG TPA: alpha/beta fold hydrolase [Ktedonobacterales bacterium]|jgi:pimeloyl-ACP methyl ester carboxylesterase